MHDCATDALHTKGLRDLLHGGSHLRVLCARPDKTCRDLGCCEGRAVACSQWPAFFISSGAIPYVDGVGDDGDIPVNMDTQIKFDKVSVLDLLHLRLRVHGIVVAHALIHANADRERNTLVDGLALHFGAVYEVTLLLNDILSNTHKLHSLNSCNTCLGHLCKGCVGNPRRLLVLGHDAGVCTAGILLRLLLRSLHYGSLLMVTIFIITETAHLAETSRKMQQAS